MRASALVENRDIALYASDAGSRLVVEGSLVEGTQPRPATKKYGRGVEVNDGASASILRTALVGNHEAGLFASDVGTVLEVTESVIADTAAEEATGEFGYGVETDGGASVTVKGTALVRNHESGVAASMKGTTLTLERCLVAATTPVALHPYGGSGLFATSTASAVVPASTFDRNTSAAIALEAGASLDLDG
ncbi:MAG: right-handed parallel beta-helix repeat-containing protein [Deltaproteobacteria bacterium]|nr:right-handed parallel beta-helix repeat-containing protein [Deltaproteobacteria bacterium]